MPLYGKGIIVGIWVVSSRRGTVLLHFLYHCSSWSCTVKKLSILLLSLLKVCSSIHQLIIQWGSLEWILSLWWTAKVIHTRTYAHTDTHIIMICSSLHTPVIVISLEMSKSNWILWLASCNLVGPDHFPQGGCYWLQIISAPPIGGTYNL